MRAFCTIITPNYLPFAKTMFQSIRDSDQEASLFALIVDPVEVQGFFNFEILVPDELDDSAYFKRIFKKYRQNPDALRWSLKSILMVHLLKSGKYEQVFFVDPDLYFYSDIKLLYKELGDHSFLLSPTWGCMDLKKSEVYFNHLMTDGLYNAGFLGATIKGLDTLYWWAEMCLYACKRDKSRGLHDDQAYLNLFPILNPDSKILLHRGCNVAEWNRFENLRSLDESGKLLLNGEFPLVFIHFSNLGYLVEDDPLLIPYLNDYQERLVANGWNSSVLEPAKAFVNRKRLRKLTFLERIIRKILGPKQFAKMKGWDIQ